MIKMVNEFKLTFVLFARTNPMQICRWTWIYRWTKRLWKIRTGPPGRGAVAGRGPRACFQQKLAGNGARAKSNKFDSSSMIYKSKLINDVEEFFERLVLYATRELSFYLYNFVQGLFYLCPPYPVLRARLTTVLCQNRLDYYLDYTAC